MKEVKTKQPSQEDRMPGREHAPGLMKTYIIFFFFKLACLVSLQQSDFRHSFLYTWKEFFLITLPSITRLIASIRVCNASVLQSSCSLPYVSPSNKYGKTPTGKSHKAETCVVSMNQDGKKLIPLLDVGLLWLSFASNAVAGCYLCLGKGCFEINLVLKH